jgi:hypothetical protein
MVGDDINWSRRSFEIVTPDAEGFEDCEKFLIVYIVVELCRIEFARMEGHRVNFSRL